ncbi:MAG: hypothetical protein AB8B51_12930 [Sedimentitalea sp.]
MQRQKKSRVAKEKEEVSVGLIQKIRDLLDTQDLSGARESKKRVGSKGGSAMNTARRPVRRKPLVVMYHLDTNKGDATIIMGLEHTAFVDCSSTYVAQRMMGIMERLDGKSAPDTFVISHFDQDHFGGGSAVFKLCDTLPKVMTPGKLPELKAAMHTVSCRNFDDNVGTEQSIQRFLQRPFSINIRYAEFSCANRNCTGIARNTVVVDPKVIDFGAGVSFTPVFNTAGTSYSLLKDNNDSSIAWILKANNIQYYTAGDLENEAGLLAARGVAGRVQVIKCSHHGADAATGDRLLRAFNPVVAIIPGPHRTFPHPDVSVLTRLQGKATIKSFYATACLRNLDAIPDKFVLPGALDIAGDVVVTVWDDDVFSTSWIDEKGRFWCRAWDADGNEAELSQLEAAALETGLQLSYCTGARLSGNAQLFKAKRAQYDSTDGEAGKRNEYVEEDTGECTYCDEEAIRQCVACLGAICDFHFEVARDMCQQCSFLEGEPEPQYVPRPTRSGRGRGAAARGAVEQEKAGEAREEAAAKRTARRKDNVVEDNQNRDQDRETLRKSNLDANE